MSRQLEQDGEEKRERERHAATKALHGGLAQAVARSGAEFVGFSYKDRGYDHLVVIKVRLAGRSQVAFVGADSLPGTLVKAMRLAARDKLVYREDKYVG
jgi:hypothetical protein